MTFSNAVEPVTVLVVDDDSALLRTLSDILRLHGYTTDTAGSGREGLAMARVRSPALAVVDLRLPDMDGMELAAKLHGLSAITEVVVLTGYASVESAVAALRENSVDYLIKPVDVERLLQVATVATERWQRRQVEDRLREADERFRRVVDSGMLGIMFWDATGNISDANDAFLHIVGYSRDDVVQGKLEWTTMAAPEYRALDQAKLREIIETGVLTPYEKELLRKDGTRVPVLVGAATLTSHRDSGVAFVLDVAERKAAQHDLEVRARQQAAVARFGELALASDTRTRVLEEAVTLVVETLELPYSAALERRSDGTSMTYRASVGWRHVVIGETTEPINERSQAGCALLFNEPVIVRTPEQMHRFTMPDDTEVASGICVIIPGQLQPFGVLQAHDTRPRDFTPDDVYFLKAIAHVLGSSIERDRTEAALRQTQRQEAVGRLASGISHDFNNILTAVTGFAELARSGLDSTHPVREDVEEILKAAERAAGLTRQLLAFSRQQVLQPRPIVLNDTVRGVEKLLSRLVGERIALRTSLAPDLGVVKADPGQMEQVILNLCVNARDAMENGGTLEITTANTELDEVLAREFAVERAGEYVTLAVTDTGAGMDAETRSRMFEPFFTTKGPDRGTGLGLATVYGIVKQSGGDIWVYSELGRGTTFKVFLPRIDAAVAT